MQPRINYATASPSAIQAMMGLEKQGNNGSIEKPLRELVKLRASQINGCAYCIDMHTKDLEHAGETQQRMHGLLVWRETSYYTERERAALEWTEELTLISETQTRDEVYERVCAQFSETDMVDLTMAIITINGWNRLALGFRTTPGTYKVGQFG